ncbi:hypothetical protein JB92DRAFT_2923915 [Gautieria morchelliformis]|nr:hypothetical protein JB92DRAFT_2923915 [Gautieria morchelliformis]
MARQSIYKTRIYEFLKSLPPKALTGHPLSRMSDVPDAYVAGYVPTTYGAVAAFTMLVYDYALTLDAEIQFVWQRAWSVGKAVFLFASIAAKIRYITALNACFLESLLWHPCPSFQHDRCQNFIWWELTTVSLNLFLYQIHAVYDCNRPLLFLMIALLIADLVGSVAISVLKVHAIAMTSVKGKTACLHHPLPPHSFISWIPPLLFESFLLFLMVLKGWWIYRSGTGFRLSIFMAFVANTIIWALPTRLHLDFQIGISWGIAIPCVMGSRLLLNMRERFFTDTTVLASLLYGEE